MKKEYDIIEPEIFIQRFNYYLKNKEQFDIKQQELNLINREIVKLEKLINKLKTKNYIILPKDYDKLILLYKKRIDIETIYNNLKKGVENEYITHLSFTESYDRQIILRSLFKNSIHSIKKYRYLIQSLDFISDSTILYNCNLNNTYHMSDKEFFLILYHLRIISLDDFYKYTNIDLNKRKVSLLEYSIGNYLKIDRFINNEVDVFGKEINKKQNKPPQMKEIDIMDELI